MQLALCRLVVATDLFSLKACSALCGFLQNSSTGRAGRDTDKMKAVLRYEDENLLPHLLKDCNYSCAQSTVHT